MPGPRAARRENKFSKKLRYSIVFISSTPESSPETESKLLRLSCFAAVNSFKAFEDEEGFA